mgnify:CR=1 FL=1
MLTGDATAINRIEKNEKNNSKLGQMKEIWHIAFIPEEMILDLRKFRTLGYGFFLYNTEDESRD